MKRIATIALLLATALSSCSGQWCGYDTYCRLFGDKHDHQGIIFSVDGMEVDPIVTVHQGETIKVPITVDPSPNYAHQKIYWLKMDQKSRLDTNPNIILSSDGGISIKTLENPFKTNGKTKVTLVISASNTATSEIVKYPHYDSVLGEYSTYDLQLIMDGAADYIASDRLRIKLLPKIQ
jgi:hypothetical protein